MSLEAGQLNTLLAIDKRKVDAVDAIGQPIQSDDDSAWDLNYAQVWAAGRGQTGMGVIRANEQVQTAVNAYSWRIRYREDITVDMRVREVTRGTVYEIIDIRHDIDRREWTDMICRVGASNG